MNLKNAKRILDKLDRDQVNIFSKRATQYLLDPDGPYPDGGRQPSKEEIIEINNQVSDLKGGRHLWLTKYCSLEEFTTAIEKKFLGKILTSTTVTLNGVEYACVGKENVG